MTLENIIYEIQKKNTKQKLKNYITKLWITDNIDELLLIIDFNNNTKLNLQHVPEFEDAEDVDQKFKFNDFFKLINKLKISNNEQREKLLEEAALDCNEYNWNNIYRKVLLNQLDSVIDINNIMLILKSILEENK